MAGRHPGVPGVSTRAGAGGGVVPPLMQDNALDVRIAQVRRYVTIFEMLSHMGVDVPEATHQIRCPFHEDRSPSARVYADQNKIYCFTEQKGWDVIDAAQ